MNTDTQPSAKDEPKTPAYRVDGDHVVFSLQTPLKNGEIKELRLRSRLELRDIEAMKKGARSDEEISFVLASLSGVSREVLRTLDFGDVMNVTDWVEELTKKHQRQPIGAS